MSYDGMFTHAMIHELTEELANGRVSKVQQPYKNELILTIRSNRKSKKLLLSAHPQYARVHLTEMAYENPTNAPQFCMVLRKYIEGAHLEKIEQIENSDGVIFATPEYDHAPPAALSNALAWLTYGVYPFVSKPVLVTGASYGTLGSSRAQTQLRQMVRAPETRANVMPGADFLLNHSLQAFDEEGNLVDQEKVELLDALMKDFITYIDVNAQLVDAIAANKKAAVEHSWDQP